MHKTARSAYMLRTLINRPHRKMGVHGNSSLNHNLAMVAIFACLCVLLSTGCISTGETIRVQGEVVDTAGQRVTDAVVIAEATKRGGVLVSRDDITDPEAEDQARESVVELPGDGTFTATSRWAGTLTLSVQGYKIRRIDELGTEFLVPNQSFFQSQDQVRLEVVKDE